MLNIDCTIARWIADMFSAEQVTMDELTFVISLHSSLFFIIISIIILLREPHEYIWTFCDNKSTDIAILGISVVILNPRPPTHYFFFFFCKGKHSRVLEFVDTPLFACYLFHFSDYPQPQTSC